MISLRQGAPVALSKTGLWTGPVQHEGRAAYQRAREAGMSALRAFVVGEIATHRDCWAFRATIAKLAGCCVRTVQRAISEAKSLGLIGVARSKKGEIPVGAERPIECGWSHRWTIGWGKAGRALAVAIEAAKARWITRQVVRVTSSVPLPKRASSPAPSSTPRRSFTAAELDAELARRVPPSPSSREGPD